MCATVLESWNATSFAPSRWEVRRLNIPNTYTTRNTYICGNVKEYQNSKQYTYELTKKGYVCIFTHRYGISYIYTCIYIYMYILYLKNVLLFMYVDICGTWIRQTGINDL